MKKYGLFLAVVFVLFFAGTSNALVQVEVLPPTTCVRGTGEPLTETFTFPGVSGPATVKLWNGSLEDDSVEKVSSSIVTVNGQVVFSYSDFNQNVSYLEKEVALLEGQNTLEILLKGKPGGQVTIQIVQEAEADVGGVVGPEGGVVEVTNPDSPIYGTKVEIPEGVLEKETVLTIRLIEGAELPNKNTLIGPVASIRTTHPLQGYVQVQLPITEQVGVDEQVVIYTQDDGGGWDVIPTVFVEGGFVKYETTHFSYQYPTKVKFDPNAHELGKWRLLLFDMYKSVGFPNFQRMEANLVDLIYATLNYQRFENATTNAARLVIGTYTQTINPNPFGILSAMISAKGFQDDVTQSAYDDEDLSEGYSGLLLCSIEGMVNGGAPGVIASCGNELMFSVFDMVTRFAVAIVTNGELKKINNINIANDYLTLYYMYGTDLELLVDKEDLLLNGSPILEEDVIEEIAKKYKKGIFAFNDYNLNAIYDLVEKTKNWIQNLAEGVDKDTDGILDDGDGNGISGDNSCGGGNTTLCDDNCPNTYNPDQADFDGDGDGDACDMDDDNDGVTDDQDDFPLDPTEWIDTDNDDIGNNADADDDNDGMPDDQDAFPLDPNEWEDTDTDGIGDNQDNCPDTHNPDQADLDGDGIGDACAIDLTEGLVSYYPFNGNANDESGNGNDGTEHGGVSYVSGISGQAASFDGVDDRIQIPSSIIEGTTLTTTLWVKTNDDTYSLISGANSEFNNEYLLYAHGGHGSKLEIYYHDNEGYVGDNFYLTNIVMNDNLWHMIAIVTQTDQTNIYVDGSLQETINYGSNAGFDVEGLWIAAEQDCINGCWNATQQLDGMLDEIRIYNRALSEAEIQALYNEDGGPTDSDGDGYPDVTDAFPDDANEWVDTDGDGIGNNADTDDDNDGMSDEWETTYEFDPLVDDSGDDFDGDGFTNLQEYQAGSDPTDPNSTPIDLNLGLVAHWSFDNGDATDESGNENHGTEYGGVSYENGIVGQAASFDGVDDWINIDDKNPFKLDEWTISAWVKVREFPILQVGCSVVGKDDDNNWKYNFSLMIHNNGYVASQYETCSSEFDHGVGGDVQEGEINLNQWYHVTSTRNRETGKHSLWINGVKVDEEIWLDTPCQNDEYLMIAKAAYENQIRYLNCVLDEIRIYNRALSEAEIQELYNEGGGVASVIWQIGTFDGDVGTIEGASEFEAGIDFYDVYNYDVDTNSDEEINSPNFPGYLYTGTSGLYPFEVWIAREVNINFSLDNTYDDVVFRYGRYGAETNDVLLDGSLITSTIGPGESLHQSFSIALGSLSSGHHTITIKYAGGGADDGNYIDALRLSRYIGLKPNGGLVAYYPFNGNALDESGNGNHGTVYGSSLIADRFGSPESAYSFDGMDDYISIPELLTPSSPAFTFSAWVLNRSGTNYGSIVYKGTHNGESALTYNQGTFQFQVKLADHNWYYAQGPLVTLDKYLHVVGVYYRGDRIEIWVNGELKSQTSIPDLDLVTQSTHSSSIGAYNRGQTESWFFDGIIDDVRIYDRALSGAEIQVLYNLP